MKILLMSIVILFSTCKGGQSPQVEVSNNIPFQVLVSSSQSNIEEPQRKIIKSQEELQTLFAEINKTRKPGIPIPEIDFDKEIVAFINFGQTSTGGYTVAVESIKETKDNIMIFVGGTSPNQGDNVTMVLTTPFTMIKLNKQILPIVFED
ncbi:protease complex subunit PrcB family protein [Marixanthomonas ophiurae]|uniref:Protease complex subunit PrcB family protein n=1 Tax=Marixanthomonas ophiurae TaxID=387659 RepID=A0A3E1Q7I0_9FLAO|nr:protease complex subunit PrcB family protein [Marixanthomonas ophiurae]RFN58097.1 protease complex subunit PrcB family protein [Marixanthomonas ophiurae]